ncbi:hypothetical protein Aduo_000711 [Ancylostoma duodenale]
MDVEKLHLQLYLRLYVKEKSYY